MPSLPVVSSTPAASRPPAARLSARLAPLAAVLLALVTAHAQTNTVRTLAPEVYFHEGEQPLGLCNNGWIVFADFVVVVDANYPAGAKVIMPKIRATTEKPVRFVVDTHFHPDHSFGNELWAEAGATIVAQAAALAVLQEKGAAAWAAEARLRPDVAASRLKLPNLTYTDLLAFDDGRHRVELRWLGAAHTPGDSLVWLPREKILFTGDLCVNGPFNYVRDSDLAGWIKVLEAAQKLGAETVCPGHGPAGGPEIIADQQAYFVELRRSVQALLDAKKTPAEIKAAVPTLAAALKQIHAIARYVPSDFWFAAHVEKAAVELGGAPFPQ
jgi:glyoxylase-like metal-dependent hydrolase (beta-lactamase superfamily II)